MTKFWTSWYSGNYADEGCTKPPFKFWVSGQRDRPNYGMTAAHYAEYQTIEDEDAADVFLDEHSRDDCSICALIIAADEDAVWALVKEHFPDFEQRFCDPRADDFDPSVGGRFL